jgi:hypothetical protein
MDQSFNHPGASAYNTKYTEKASKIAEKQGKSNSLEPQKVSSSKMRRDPGRAYYDTYNLNKGQKFVANLKKKVEGKKVNTRAMNQTMMDQNITNPKATSRERRQIDHSLTTDRERRKYNQFLVTQNLGAKKKLENLSGNTKSPIRSIIKTTTQTPVHRQPQHGYFLQPSTTKNVSPMYSTFDSAMHGPTPSSKYQGRDRDMTPGILPKRASSKSYKQDESVLSKEGPKNLPVSQRERERSLSGRNTDGNDYPNMSNHLKLNHNSIIHNPSHTSTLYNHNHNHKIDTSLIRPTKDILLDKYMPKLARKKSGAKMGDPLEEFSQTDPVRRETISPEIIEKIIKTKTTTKTEIYHKYTNAGVTAGPGGSRRNKNKTDRFENLSRHSSGNSFTNYNRGDQNLSADNRYSN